MKDTGQAGCLLLEQLLVGLQQLSGAQVPISILLFSASLLLLPQHSPALRDPSIQGFVDVPASWETSQKCYSIPVPCALSAPQGPLFLILPAPTSLPILINPCQARTQITCQISDWIPPALPWALRRKGSHSSGWIVRVDCCGLCHQE